MLDKAINKYEFFEDLIIHNDLGFNIIILAIKKIKETQDKGKYAPERE